MKNVFCLMLLFCSNNCFAIAFGPWSPTAINTLLQNAQTIQDEGAKIDYISSRFLNTPYQAHTLIGSAKTPEQLTVRLDRVDCMTFIESVEAVRRSPSFADFMENIKAVRYKNSWIDFQTRNHFFLNWRENNSAFISDITQQIGTHASVGTVKHLNAAGRKQLIPGVPVADTLMHYIPGKRIDAAILNRLKSGDYVGLYTDRLGLDVTHVGIIIKKGQQTVFRHASNEPYINRVIDSDFFSYFRHQKGFVVMRPVHNSVNGLKVGINN